MKIGLKKKWNGIAAGVAAAVLALPFASPAALAASIGVTAETISVVESGDFADAEFGLTVTNNESVPASNVSVVFEDGTEVFVGDVPAGGSAAGASQTRTIDLLAMPSRNSPMAVTLTYTLDGIFEESPAVLVVSLGAPAE